MMRLKGVALAAGLMLATPLVAADETVSAADPAQIVRVMQEAGCVAELEADAIGDPLIKTTFAGYGGSIYFYGCADETHAGCTSIQFRAGLDRKKPVTLDLMNEIVRKYRFTALWLDKEGDPWVNYDMFTGEGISKANFLATIKAFEGNFAAVADDVFAEERGE